jgi:hypothetical protein
MQVAARGGLTCLSSNDTVTPKAGQAVSRIPVRQQNHIMHTLFGGVQNQDQILADLVAGLFQRQPPARAAQASQAVQAVCVELLFHCEMSEATACVR